MKMRGLCALAGAAALFASGAFAQPGPMRELAQKADADKDGKLTFEEIAAVAPDFTRERFDALDRNGDGVLSPADRDASAGARENARPAAGEMLKRLRAADKDKDGKVTKSEFKAAFPKAPDRLFDRLDRNSDGVICPKDAPDSEKRQPGRGEDGLAARMKAADTDGDGAISRAEFKAAFPGAKEARFDALDADGDGSLTKSELRKAPERPERKTKPGKAKEKKDSPKKDTPREEKAE
jgi:Ca2+-binding EF-hand superfamily protein